MELSHHALSPVLPKLQLPICQGSREGMIEQCPMSPPLCLSINSSQTAGFGLTELMLPVDCWQHLTQQPVS